MNVKKLIALASRIHENTYHQTTPPPTVNPFAYAQHLRSAFTAQQIQSGASTFCQFATTFCRSVRPASSMMGYYPRPTPSTIQLPADTLAALTQMVGQVGSK